MSSPPHVSRRGENNPMIAVPEATYVTLNADGSAAAVPTSAGADMAMDAFASSRSPDASREQAVRLNLRW